MMRAKEILGRVVRGVLFLGLAALLGIAQPVIVSMPMASAMSYVYDAHYDTAAPTHATTERVPPDAYDQGITDDTVGRVVRHRGAPGGATNSAIYGYDHPSPAEQVVGFGAATERPTPGAEAVPPGFGWTGVAAKGGPGRFAVSSSGETTMFLRTGTESLEVTKHAAQRMAERGSRSTQLNQRSPSSRSATTTKMSGRPGSTTRHLVSSLAPLMAASPR